MLMSGPAGLMFDRSLRKRRVVVGDQRSPFRYSYRRRERTSPSTAARQTDDVRQAFHSGVRADLAVAAAIDDKSAIQTPRRVSGGRIVFDDHRVSVSRRRVLITLSKQAGVNVSAESTLQLKSRLYARLPTDLLRPVGKQ
jgi:hypothetical protein